MTSNSMTMVDSGYLLIAWGGIESVEALIAVRNSSVDKNCCPSAYTSRVRIACRLSMGFKPGKKKVATPKTFYLEPHLSQESYRYSYSVHCGDIMHEY